MTFTPNPFVSILLCTHIKSKLLYAAIDSCLNQSYTNFELIVVANGPSAKHIYSTLLDYYNSDSRFKCILTSSVGLVNSLNLGLAHCSGQYIMRQDSDDISLPIRLETQLKYLLSNPDVDVLGTQYVLSHDSNSISHLPLQHSAISRSLFFVNPIAHPTVLFKKSILTRPSPYLPRPYAEDYDLWIRLLLTQGARFSNLPDHLLIYHTSGIGEARSNPRAYLSMAHTQMSAFFTTANPLWLISLLISLSKLLYSYVCLHARSLFSL